MEVLPYLFFDGRCEEALEFYKKALGAKVQGVMRFKDNPDKSCTPPDENKVMHSSFTIGETHIMASDGNCSGQAKFDGFSLSINLKNIAEAERIFAALAEGGKVTMPLTKTFFSPGFAMVADRFGVHWMVHVTQ